MKRRGLHDFRVWYLLKLKRLKHADSAPGREDLLELFTPLVRA